MGTCRGAIVGDRGAIVGDRGANVGDRAGMDGDRTAKAGDRAANGGDRAGMGWRSRRQRWRSRRQRWRSRRHGMAIAPATVAIAPAWGGDRAGNVGARGATGDAAAAPRGGSYDSIDDRHPAGEHVVGHRCGGIGTPHFGASDGDRVCAMIR
jgi:hypothetical protein